MLHRAMGKRIAAFYEEAERIGGLEGKIKLAMLTRTTSTRALAEPDTPANLARFENALAAVRAELARAGARASAEPDPGRITPLPASPAIPAPTPSSPRAPVMGLPGGEELLWGVLSSLHDAMLVVFGRDASILVLWEARSIARRFGSADPGAAGDAIARAVAATFARDVDEVLAGVRESRQAEIPFALGGVDAWLGVSIAPVHDAAGKIAAAAAFVQDITQRKRSEAALAASEQRLRAHNRKFLELVADKSMILGDVAETARRITEAAADGLEVARASVWFYDDAREKIVCADLFERATGAHSGGIALAAADFPAYFAALRTERTIAADDAHADPRTAEFSAPYLAPLGIASMLDVPIWVGGEMIGVVCHEHVGPRRSWTADEESFAYLMASFVSLSKECARFSAQGFGAARGPIEIARRGG
jgi:PAS domain S-box-containing protein